MRPSRAQWAWCPRWAPCTKATFRCCAGHAPTVRRSSRPSSSIPPSSGTTRTSAATRATRTRDLRLLRDAGVDVAFVPGVAEMYRPGAATSVHVGGTLTSLWEAASRPGHFDGVATVVLKLALIMRLRPPVPGREGRPAAGRGTPHGGRSERGGRRRRHADRTRARRTGDEQPQHPPGCRPAERCAAPLPGAASRQGRGRPRRALGARRRRDRRRAPR